MEFPFKPVANPDALTDSEKSRPVILRALNRAAGSLTNGQCDADKYLRADYEFATELSAVAKTLVRGDWLLIEAVAHSPYDGCWWEPNFWLLSRDFQVFEPLYVSHHRWHGRAWGFGRTQKIGAGMADIPFRLFLEREVFNGDGKTWDQFAVHAMRDGILLTAYMHERFAQVAWDGYEEAVAKHRFTDAEIRAPEFMCAACGERFSDRPYEHSGDMYGIGGLACATDSLYCESCICSACDRCGYPFKSKDGEAPYIEDVETGARLCKDCAPHADCRVCRTSTPENELRHGICDGCVDSVLEKFAAAFDAAPDDESTSPPKICRDCGGMYRDSQGEDLCQPCFNKRLGRSEV